MKATFFRIHNKQTFIACEVDQYGQFRNVRDVLKECVKMLEAELENHDFMASRQFDGVGFEVKLINTTCYYKGLADR